MQIKFVNYCSINIKTRVLQKYAATPIDFYFLVLYNIISAVAQIL